jgi:uncharacterized membrane protein
MAKLLLGCAAVIGMVAVFCGVYALFAWCVSVLVSYVFGVDFGFWKTVAALLLLSLVSGMTFGRIARNNDN